MAAASSPSHLLTTCTHLHTSSKISLKINSFPLLRFKDSSWCTKKLDSITSFNPNGVYRNSRAKILCLASTTAGDSDNSGKTDMEHILEKAKINMDHIIEKAKVNMDQITKNGKDLWDSLPHPVKSFPWDRALDNLIQLIFDLIVAVTKYLCIPVLAISSLSELSYCFHEKKQFLLPFPLLVGVAAAEVLKETAVELYPFLKEDSEVPWHLISIAVFFTLIKLPGPYYPYWGRILIPQVANGALLRTLWFSFLWYRRPQRASENDGISEENRA